MKPLMPSPGRPKTTVTPQSIRRSTSTSDVVRAIKRKAASATPALLLALEDPGDGADELFPQRPGLPSFRHDLAAAAEIRLEVNHEPLRNVGVADGEVDFVVVFERSIVEVRRADDGPEVVHDEGFGVGHAGFVLEDADSGAKQGSIEPPAREANPLLI